MLNRIRALFAGDETPRRPSHDQEEKRIAAAALLAEAAQSDADLGAQERQVMLDLLERRFGLSREEAEDLLAAGVARQQEASQLFRFTQTIKAHYDHAERIELIEMLWEVAYADGTLHDFEANLLRRVAGLLYVEDRESGEARKRVLARRGIRHDLHES